jgi:hypothetical protein
MVSLVWKPPRNTTEGCVTKSSSSATVGFFAPLYVVLSNFFVASHYHRVIPDVEAGTRVVCDSNTISPVVVLAVGTKAHA